MIKEVNHTPSEPIWYHSEPSPKQFLGLVFFAVSYSKTALVCRFSNRWRWCSGSFNFRQSTLALGYLRSLSRKGFYHRLCFEIFSTQVG